jgi:hypothetical protein
LRIRLALGGRAVFFRVPMPGRPHHSRPRHAAKNTFDPWVETGVALVVVDDGPLKRAAWAELHAVRKRQEKAARDLHRHEETDRPAYDAWLHGTFPTLITRLRELHQEVFAKGQRVQTVQAMAAMTGRSARKIWREEKERAANPDAFEAESETRSENRHWDSRHEPDEDFFGDDDNDDRGSTRRSRPQWEDAFEAERAHPAAPRPTAEARDVYRRLVQRLHPDRGGAWTAARQRLWHEVQQAWAAADADWLTRLEVEWEAAHDVLSLASPLSRLRAAIEELHAARRDLERKLRTYRESPPWRFTLTERKREQLHRRTEMNFRHDIDFLQRQLAHLDAMIASWEEPPRSRRRPRARDIEIRFWD